MKLPVVQRPEPVRILGWSFALAAITALALLVISETAYRRSISALVETETLYENRSEIGRLLRYTIDAETGQRGFLLTGSADYLKPYREANQELSVSLERLADHVRRYPSDAAEYSKLFVLTRARMAELAETVELYEQGRHEGWRAIVDSGIGRDNQDRLREQVFAIVDVENRRLATYQQQVTQTLLISRLGVATLTVLSVLAFYFYLRQAKELAEERERQRAELQQERDLLEAQVERRTQDLSALTRHIQTTQEAERSHLARELHDELGALFTSAKLDCARLQARLGPTGPEVSERLKHLVAALNSGVELKRRIIEDLRPSALGHFGLKASLDILAREFAQRSGIEVAADIAPVSLGEERDLTVYRLVQESLTNIAKYAKAGFVEIGVKARDGGVEVLVADDGAGFDPARVRRAAHGLSGMRFRVEAAGGRMSVESAMGEGTRVQAWLPEPAAAPVATGEASETMAG